MLQSLRPSQDKIPSKNPNSNNGIQRDVFGFDVKLVLMGIAVIFVQG